jgi:hypothetical protein
MRARDQTRSGLVTLKACRQGLLHAASTLMNFALRGHSFRSSRQIGPASRFLSKSFCRLRSVDHRLALPSYQLVIVASTLDRSVMQYM